MKISEYNWTWWFLLSCLFLVICLVMQITVTDSVNTIEDSQRENIGYYSELGLYFSIPNLLVCFYIGCKPTKD